MPRSKKEKIVEAAADLFARLGYESTSVRQIAVKAGVATGLLYNYFDGKEDLLRAIFLQGLSEVKASMERAESMPSGSIVTNLAEQSFKLVKDHQEFWRLFYSIRMQPAVLRTLELDMTDWTGYVMEQMTRYFRSTGSADPQADAHVLFSIIDGISQHYALAPTSYPIDAAIAIIDRTFSVEQSA